MNWIYSFPAKILKVSLEDSTDELQGMSRLFIVIAILTTGLGVPAMLLAIHYNLPVFRFFSFHQTGLNVLFVLCMTANFGLDWTFVVTLVLTALIHYYCNSKWIVRSKQAW